jgi:hypothetical protein
MRKREESREYRKYRITRRIMRKMRKWRMEVKEEITLRTKIKRRRETEFKIMI